MGVEGQEAPDGWAGDEQWLAAQRRKAARAQQNPPPTRFRWARVALGVAVGAVSYVVGYSWVDWVM